MIFLDNKQVKEKVLYKKPIHIPINKSNKYKGSMAFLLSPTPEDSILVLRHRLLDTRFFKGYYIEKDITYFINQENSTVSNDLDVLTEESDVFNINYSIPTHFNKDSEINEEYMRCKVDDKDILFVYPESGDIITEAVKSNNPLLKRILYAERYKTPKEVFAVYDKMSNEFKKADIDNIDKMYINLKRYRQYNLFCDLSFYNQTFFKNNIWKLDKGVQLYFDFITRFLKDPRFKKNGYTKQTVILPVFGWTNKKQTMYTNELNVISMIYRMMYTNFEKIKSEWKDLDFLILGRTAWMKVNFGNMTKQEIPKFKTLINKLITGDIDHFEDLPDSEEGIKYSIIDKIEKSQSVTIPVKKATGQNEEITKDKLEEKIDKAAAVSSSEEDAIQLLDKDEEFKKMIVQLSTQSNEIKINAARSARMEKLNDEIRGKKIEDESLEDLLNYKQIEKLPSTDLKVDSINPEWHDMKYINFESNYNIDSDIAKILYFFSTRSLMVMIMDIKKEDTSSSEDWIYTYTVKCEDYNGQRFTLVFDIPKFKDNRYMYLRGNEKILNGQLMQLPIGKTDVDTVQLVSNYNKIFIRRFGSQPGKSCVISDKIIKTIDKLMDEKDTSIKVVYGDNKKISANYVLPMDYVDLSSIYSRIEVGKYIIYFNQEEIRKLYEVDDKKGIPYAVYKPEKKVLYLDPANKFASDAIYVLLSQQSKRFAEISEEVNESSKYCYSEASILGEKIPVILIMAYHVGLLKAMDIAKVKYRIEKPRTNYDHLAQDTIKFNDAWIIYDLNASSSLLMNGLKTCDTLNYSISEIGGKEMYLDFLDGFGGRIKADGLDNFYDLMIDPITLDIIHDYKFPETYIELLAYANELLEDNKYIRHTDLAGKRFRTNEIIAGILYNELATSYGQYKIRAKRMTKGNAMSIKQTAVIDSLLALKTSSDASILNALLDVEAGNTVSFKGLSGMNAERAYDLDKRTYDESMVNVLGLSTGFAGNVGVNRQTTIDMNIEGTRGYIKPGSKDSDVGLKSLCITEAVTPYSTNHDDPFRSAMTFVQTSKHFMRTKVMNPRLITNGADEALPYLASNTFAYKSKKPGFIKEKTDDHIILEYNDGTFDYVNLDSKIIKNSSGGFFGSLTLESDLNEGAKFRAGDIIAYDKSSFDGGVGLNNNLAYNAGTLVKMAIMYTDEGIEDSGIITEWMSDALSSEVIIKSEVNLDANTNVYDIVKVGQHIEEGEPLITFQESTNDEDVNNLMKALGADEDEISELGRHFKRSKYTGEVVDIKIYRTAETSEMSDSLKKIVSKYEKEKLVKKGSMKKYNIDQEYTLDSTGVLPATGKLKNTPDGVLIEFYIKFNDKFKIGDKDVLDAALKNVIKDIIPKGEEPYSEFRPNEEISTLGALNSIEGRMVGSISNNGCLNKILIELDRSVKDILGIPWKTIQEMSNK